MKEGAWMTFEGWEGLRLLLHSIWVLCWEGKVTVVLPKSKEIKTFDDYGVKDER